ncbi:uncharacterized protein LOC105420760 [Amborella trichopoda]|uniref:uncharacterized protein LOC105420760 n=1 Tax=Amborella trichopoda TaxID=13333 RepID=UPI0009BDEB3B|nr:uncharacterized protein LOC105420760 [Amborella trichopoda]|eukprot:XP_020523542.1 uncharacterized protein LOC105420760 [Amborella trichopoda]
MKVLFLFFFSPPFILFWFSARFLDDGPSQLNGHAFPEEKARPQGRRKRASLKPLGPYTWIQYVPGEPIPRSRPNEGSVQAGTEGSVPNRGLPLIGSWLMNVLIYIWEDVGPLMSWSLYQRGFQRS